VVDGAYQTVGDLVGGCSVGDERRPEMEKDGGGLVRNWSPEPEERRSSERWRVVRGGRPMERFWGRWREGGKIWGKLGQQK
jgi:hypothetical protein